MKKRYGTARQEERKQNKNKKRVYNCIEDIAVSTTHWSKSLPPRRKPHRGREGVGEALAVPRGVDHDTTPRRRCGGCEVKVEACVAERPPVGEQG